MINPDSIEAKYKRLQAIIERMDAQSKAKAKAKAKSNTKAKAKCREKPLKNRAGRVVKPATVQCGAVCRQEQNCNVSKRELKKVTSAFKGKSQEELLAAVQALLASKKSGQSSTRATYEATEKARIEKNIERREKIFQKSVDQAEKRVRAKDLPDTPPKTNEVRLGKPLYDRVTTIEEAIANGRAILGDKIDKMAAEYDAHMARKKPAAQKAEKKERRKKINALTERQEQLKSEAEKLMWSVEDKEAYDAKRAEINRLHDEILAENSRIWAEENAEFEARLNKEERIKGLDGGEPLASKVIEALMSNSSLSAEQAMSEAEKIDREGNFSPEFRQDIADFIRMTNGQCLESLSAIIFRNERAYASSGEGLISLREKDNKRVLFHEMGHHVEFASHNTNLIGPAFVKSRATSDTPVPLNELLPGRDFNENELAFPGRFFNPHVGSVPTQGTTEVFSMGMDPLSSPFSLSRLAKEDPDHLALAVGIASQRVPIKSNAADLLQSMMEKEGEIKRELDSLEKRYKKDPVSDVPGYQSYGNGAIYVKKARYGSSLLFYDKETGKETDFWMEEDLHKPMISFLASRPDISGQLGSLSWEDRYALSTSLEALIRGEKTDPEWFEKVKLYGNPDVKRIFEPNGWDVARLLKEGDFIAAEFRAAKEATKEEEGVTPPPPTTETTTEKKTKKKAKKPVKKKPIEVNETRPTPYRKVSLSSLDGSGRGSLGSTLSQASRGELFLSKDNKWAQRTGLTNKDGSLTPEGKLVAEKDPFMMSPVSKGFYIARLREGDDEIGRDSRAMHDVWNGMTYATETGNDPIEVLANRIAAIEGIDIAKAKKRAARVLSAHANLGLGFLQEQKKGRSKTFEVLTPTTPNFSRGWRNIDPILEAANLYGLGRKAEDLYALGGGKTGDMDTSMLLSDAESFFGTGINIDDFAGLEQSNLVEIKAAVPPFQIIFRHQGKSQKTGTLGVMESLYDRDSRKDSASEPNPCSSSFGLNPDPFYKPFWK